MSVLEELKSLFIEEATLWAQKKAQFESLQNWVKENWAEIIEIEDKIFVDNKTEDINYLINHSLGVGILMGKLSSKMDLEDKIIVYGIMSGFLHDIAFFFEENRVVFLQEELSPTLKKVIKAHPEEGMVFLVNYDFISSFILNAIYEHHERMDGSGYPRCIKGGKISLLGRMLAICDVYDAVFRKHIYRNPKKGQEVLEELGKLSKKYLDEKILKKLLEISSLYPKGTKVILNNGKEGVIKKETDNPFRPVIEVEGKLLDLTRMDNWNLFIKEVI